MNQKEHKRSLYTKTWVGYTDFFRELRKFEYKVIPKLYLKKSVGDLMKRIVRCPLCKMPIVQFGSTATNVLALCGKCYLIYQEYKNRGKNAKG
jgi:hypothetical protein